eukprot:scaffold455582_cov35-Prasinocladus_malaysianus.AAC.1
MRERSDPWSYLGQLHSLDEVFRRVFVAHGGKNALHCLGLGAVLPGPFVDATGPLFQYEKATDTWSTIEECLCAYLRQHLLSHWGASCCCRFPQDVGVHQHRVATITRLGG